MSSIKCWHQRQYYKCIRSVSSLYRRKIDISKSPYRHNPSCLQLGESTSAAFPCGRRRILRCQDFSPLVVQSRLLSTHDDETTYIEGNAIDLIMDPNDKTEKHDSVLLPSENDSDKSKPKLVTEEEERRRYWIARIDSQTLDDVVEIRNILKDIGNGKAANRINERLERPIFLPQDGTKILSKDPPIDSSTGIYADVKDELDEDFSAWRDFIAEAETVSPFRRRRSRQKRRWKVSRGIQHSLSVLRVMSHKWWKEIDSMLEEGTSLSKLESFLEDSIPDIDVDADSTTSTNDIVELDTMEDEELTEPNSYDEINEVLNLVTKGDITFNTACFNTLLARVSVALDLSPSHCHQLILTINKAMKDTRVLPDPITSEILLRVMSQRIGSPHTAILFVRELMEDSSLRSPDSLQAAFSLCESINDANLALTLWQCYLKNDQSAYQLTFGALNFYINVLKLDFLQRQAFDVVKLALKQNQSPKNRALDSLFENVCTWQPTNRDHSQDNTRILEATLKILLKESLYRPSHVVWRTIILTASKHSQTDQRRTRIVYSALREFMERFPEFSPDGELAKIGYVALQWVGDHGLAMDIFTRRLSNVIQRIKDEGRASSEINDRLAGESTTSKTDDIDTEQRELTKHQSNRVSSDEVFVVLSICVECDAMDAVHSILSLVEEFGYAFHPSLYPQIFTLAIEAFVGHGKLQLAEEALQRCLKRGHLPRYVMRYLSLVRLFVNWDWKLNSLKYTARKTLVISFMDTLYLVLNRQLRNCLKHWKRVAWEWFARDQLASTR